MSLVGKNASIYARDPNSFPGYENLSEGEKHRIDVSYKLRGYLEFAELNQLVRAPSGRTKPYVVWVKNPFIRNKKARWQRRIAWCITNGYHLGDDPKWEKEMEKQAIKEYLDHIGTSEYLERKKERERKNRERFLRKRRRRYKH